MAASCILFASEAETAAGDTSYWCLEVGKDECALGGFAMDGSTVDSPGRGGLETSAFAPEGAFATDGAATARSTTGTSAATVLSSDGSVSDVSAAVSAVEKGPAAEDCAVSPSEVDSAVAELAEASTAARFCRPVASTATSMTTEPVELC